MTTLIKYIKNGVYIPFLHILLFLYTQNVFLSSILIFKLYPANYFFWFYYLYPYEGFPKWLPYLKQFTRFTDTGHLASLVYFYYPSFFPIAYNIHFTITFGFWIGKLCFLSQDRDARDGPDIIKPFMNYWSYCNHIFPLLLMIREFYNKDYELCSYDLFTKADLYYSYLWIYIWLCYIYMPWRFVTKDVMYSILAYETPTMKKVYFILFMHLLFYISNESGSLLRSMVCSYTF